ncbi:MAG: hypothetical protein COA36_12340 [Desulfotalea sp.]|nr:MAG: hypothetical protein COA36_12340 [Desulfotalea sp.]
MRQNDPYQPELSVQRTTRTSKSSSVSTTPSTSKATQTAFRKKRPVGKMVLFGAMSLGAYALLFSNEALVTNTFTLGGWHAALPVGTAFLFSFMHGAFASNFLDVLGLEAKKA